MGGERGEGAMRLEGTRCIDSFRMEAMLRRNDSLACTMLLAFVDCQRLSSSSRPPSRPERAPAGSLQSRSGWLA